MTNTFDNYKQPNVFRHGTHLHSGRLPFRGAPRVEAGPACIRDGGRFPRRIPPGPVRSVAEEESSLGEVGVRDGLDAAHLAKLRLAGGGALKRFFDEVEEKRKTFEEARRDATEGPILLRQPVPPSK